MINVTEETKTAYLDSSVKAVTITVPNRNITFTNSDLVDESLSLTEQIETERNLTFKGCIASQLKFQVADIVTDLRGEYIEAKIQAGETEEIPLFKGYIDEQNNLTHEDVITEFICYDVLYSVGGRNMQTWVDSLSFPMTVKAFRDSLFTTLGIMQETKTLVNDGLTISANILNFLDNPTALELMRWICQLSGVFGQIGRDGQFKYRELKEITQGLYPSETTYPSDTTYPAVENAGIVIPLSKYTSVQYEPYFVEKITKVSIFDSEGIAEGNAGSGSNVLSISDNPIAFSVNMMSAASAILAKVKALKFDAVISLNAIGFPYGECGDAYVCNTKKNIIRSFILNRTLKGIQALYDSYSSDNDRTQPPCKPTAQTGINANRKSILAIQADIVEINELKATKAEVGELSAREASFEQATAENFRVTGELIATKATIQELNAVNANLTNLIAQRATISQLDATNATVQTLTAKEANFETVTAQNFNAVNYNVQNLSASVASLNTVVAQKIDADTVRANYMEVVNWTSSGYIKANKISANTFSGRELDCRGFTCSSCDGDTLDMSSGKIYSLQVPDSMTFKGTGVSWKSRVVVTGVDFSAKRITTATINYLGY